MMGRDLIYQAYPDNSDILDTVFQDEDWANYLFVFDRYAAPGFADILRDLRAKNTTGHIPPDDAIEFAQAAFQLSQQHLGLITRNLFWGRHWDMLHFLLSEWRRNSKHSYYTLDVDDGWGWAIFGRYHIPRSNADIISLRYSTAKEISDALDLFHTVTHTALTVHFDAMLAAGAYKSPAVGADESYVAKLWDTFNELKAFYELVVQHNEGVVACLV